MRKPFLESIRITEQKDSDGLEWGVDIIQQGMNVNGTRFYTEQAVKDIVSLLDGAQCYVNHKEMASAFGMERKVQETIGWYTDPGFDQERRVATGTLHLLAEGPNGDITQMFKEAASRGNPNIVGLSIAAYGDMNPATDAQGNPYHKVTAIEDLVSVDMVTRPGAGGKFNSMMESANTALLQGEEQAMARDVHTNEQIEEGTITRKSKTQSEGQDKVTLDENGNVISAEYSYNSKTERVDEAENDDDDMDDKDDDMESRAQESDDDSDEGDGDDGSDEGNDGDDAEESADEGNEPEQGAEEARQTGRSAALTESRSANPRSRRARAQADQIKESGEMSKTVLEEVRAERAAAEAARSETNEMLVEVRQERVASMVARELANSELPDALANEVLARFKGSSEATQEQIQEFINDRQSVFDFLWADFEKKSGTEGAPKLRSSKMTQDSMESWHKRMDHTWKNDYKPTEEGLYGFRTLHESISSFYHANVAYDYQQDVFEGMKAAAYQSPKWNIPRTVAESASLISEGRVGGAGSFATEARYMTEELGVYGGGLTNWSTALGDSMYRYLLNQYDYNDEYDWMMFVSDYKRSTDLKQVHFSRRGGYNQPPAVAESATYTYATTPSEEAFDLEVVKGKFGILESVSLEALISDDLDAIRRIPDYLSWAFKLRQFNTVLSDVINNNQAKYQASGTLFSSANGNTAAAALSASALSAAISTMRKQTQQSTTTRMGVTPWCLFVPVDLEEAAHDLVMSMAKITANQDSTIPNIFRSRWNLKYKSLVGLADVNDWYLMAEPNPAKGQHTIAAITFPNEMPQLSMQDRSDSEDAFKEDKINFKVNGFIAAGAADHRMWYKGTQS